MKQNKKKAVILASLFMICLFISFVSIPSYATSDNGINFDAQPISSDENNPTALVNYNGDGNVGIFYAYAVDPSIDVYAFGIRNRLNNMIGSIKFASQSATSIKYFFTIYSDGSKSSTTTVNLNSLDTTSQLYTTNTIVGGGGSAINSSDYYIPFYESTDAGFADVNNRIENPPSTNEPHELSFNLKAGTIAFVDITDTDFNSVFVYTTSALNHSSPWTGNQAIGYASALPSGSFSLPYSNTNPISWNGNGRKTLFGTYAQWTMRMSINDSNGNYLVLVNPHYPTDTPENQATNGLMQVTVSQANTYKVFSLTGEWNDGAIQNTSDGSSWTGNYDPNTDTWSTVNDQTGIPGDPTSGNVGGTTQTVQDWLEDIANTIKGFFTGAIGAVTTLVGAGSEFIGKLAALYSWLPPAVYSVLSSALILVITIGVIKVFI